MGIHNHHVLNKATPANTEWIQADGRVVEFVPVDTRHYRSNMLPRVPVRAAKCRDINLFTQCWAQAFYRIGFYLLRLCKKQKVRITVPPGVIRFEAVITGQLYIKDNKGETLVRGGQYRVTQHHSFELSQPGGEACEYFVVYYRPELLKELGLTATPILSPPRSMCPAMAALLQEALHHPYTGSMHNLYFRKLVTDLLFLHLTHSDPCVPLTLNDGDIAAILQADQILSKDLSEHYSIRQLSGLAGTNAFKLKRGFKLVFKMGVFARLLHRRMEQAKFLLQTTNKPIKDVAFESGYATVSGFIQAFRKRFKQTPLDWRENSRKGKD